MVYKFNEGSFNFNDKTIIYDENNNVCMWAQYDFAYKGRIIIHDGNDIDIAYIQFNILSDINYIGLYDMSDKLLNYINIDNKNIMYEDNWVINDSNIKCGEDIICEFNKDSIITDNDLLKCIFVLFVLNN